MTINWKSLALILSGVLIGCASSAAHTAYAEHPQGGGTSFKCLGPSATASGIEDDLHSLASQGYTPIFSAQTIVCGKR